MARPYLTDWQYSTSEGVLYQHAVVDEYLPDTDLIPQGTIDLDYFSLRADVDSTYGGSDYGFLGVKGNITSTVPVRVGYVPKQADVAMWGAPHKEAKKKSAKSKNVRGRRAAQPDYYTDFCCCATKVGDMLRSIGVPVYNDSRTSTGLVFSIDIRTTHHTVKMDFTNVAEFAREWADLLRLYKEMK